MKTRHWRLTNWFTMLVVLYPLIGQYHIGDTSVSLADVLMLLTLPALIMAVLRQGRMRLNVKLIPYAFYITMHLILTLLLRKVPDVNDFVGSTLRYLLFCTVVILAREFFDVDLGIRIFRAVCIASAAYMMMQTLAMSVFHVFISGVFLDIPFLKVRADLHTYGENITNYATFRPRAFFAEPAHYSTYLLAYLTLSLFLHKNRELKTQLFLTAGVLMSMSSTGILVGIGVWSLYFLLAYRKRIPRGLLLAMFTVVPIGLIAVVQSHYFQFFLYRITKTGNSRARYTGYSVVMDLIGGKASSMLFGLGLDGWSEVRYYFAGFPLLLVNYGIVGALVLAITLLAIASKAQGWQRMMIVIFLVMQAGTEILFGPDFVYYLTFISCDPQQALQPAEYDKSVRQPARLQT